VYTRPDAISDEMVADALRYGWSYDAAEVTYLPEGFGSHHWVARDAAGAALFVTVDDLAANEFLGRSVAGAFDSLRRAFAVAQALEQSGPDWVVGPVPDRGGDLLRWLDPAHSIAVFPYCDHVTTTQSYSDEERVQVVELLTELHRLTGRAGAVARRETFAVPSRAALEVAMASVSRPWTGGPYAEPARELLDRHVDDVRRRLADYDRLVAAAVRDQSGWTITHGEPKSSNVLRTGSGLRLIDWDTALIAPPERDLWMLVASPNDAAAVRYTAVTGQAVSPDLLRLYALWWDLCEIAIYLAGFRAPHVDSEDSAVSWRSLQHYLGGGEVATGQAVP